MKRIIFVVVLLIGLLQQGLGQDHYSLATGIDGVPVESNTVESSRRNPYVYINFHLSADSKYQLIFESNKPVSFQFNGMTIKGSFDKIDITTNESKQMTLVVTSTNEKKFKMAYVLSYLGAK